MIRGELLPCVSNVADKWEIRGLKGGFQMAKALFLFVDGLRMILTVPGELLCGLLKAGRYRRNGRNLF